MYSSNRTSHEFFEDTRYPPAPYTEDEILKKITEEGLNALEISPFDIDEPHEPSVYLTKILQPSFKRPKHRYRNIVTGYVFAGDTDPAALAGLFCQVQSKFNCWLRVAPMRDGYPVSVGEMREAFLCVEDAYPNFEPPPKLSGDMQIHDLNIAIAVNILGELDYYTQSGEYVHHVIHELYDQVMFEGINVFCDLATYGKPIGFAVRKNAPEPIVSVYPSLSLEGDGVDWWDVYLVEGDEEQVMEVEDVLKANSKGADVSTRFPMPLSTYRLSRLSAEMLEFEAPYPIYSARSFCELAGKSRRD